METQQKVLDSRSLDRLSNFQTRRHGGHDVARVPSAFPAPPQAGCGVPLPGLGVRVQGLWV